MNTLPLEIVIEITNVTDTEGIVFLASTCKKYRLAIIAVSYISWNNIKCVFIEIHNNKDYRKLLLEYYCRMESNGLMRERCSMDMATCTCTTTINLRNVPCYAVDFYSGRGDNSIAYIKNNRVKIIIHLSHYNWTDVNDVFHCNTEVRVFNVDDNPSIPIAIMEYLTCGRNICQNNTKYNKLRLKYDKKHSDINVLMSPEVINLLLND